MRVPERTSGRCVALHRREADGGSTSARRRRKSERTRHVPHRDDLQNQGQVAKGIMGRKEMKKGRKEEKTEEKKTGIEE